MCISALKELKSAICFIWKSKYLWVFLSFTNEPRCITVKHGISTHAKQRTSSLECLSESKCSQCCVASSRAPSYAKTFTVYLPIIHLYQYIPLKECLMQVTKERWNVWGRERDVKLPKIWRKNNNHWHQQFPMIPKVVLGISCHNLQFVFIITSAHIIHGGGSKIKMLLFLCFMTISEINIRENT